MGTYYVRKDGNDTTGDGSSATPWLTVFKAINTVPIAGNHIINVGPGTYAEENATLKYLYVDRTFLNWVTIQAEDPANPPVIRGNGSADFTLRSDHTPTYYRWKNLIFDDTDAVGGKATAVIALTSGTATNHWEFDGCTIRFTQNQNNYRYGIFANLGATFVLDSITIKNCTFVEQGTDTTLKARAIRFNMNAAGGVMTNIIIQNCTALMTQSTPIDLIGVTDFLIDSGTYRSRDCYGLLIGTDGAGTYAQSGTIRNAVVSSTNSHALLVGGPCDNVTVTGCTISGGDQGFVFKNCGFTTGVTATNNQISGGSNNAFYCKGAKNVTASGNTIRNTAGVGFRVGVDSGTGNKCQNINFQRNKIFGTGTNGLLAWADDTGDSGGGVCNYNTYGPKGTNKFGGVRSDPEVLTLTELKAAWSAYGDGSNDSHSRLLKRSRVKVRI